jgi:hypothetical protein
MMNYRRQNLPRNRKPEKEVPKKRSEPLNGGIKKRSGFTLLTVSPNLLSEPLRQRQRRHRNGINVTCECSHAPLRCQEKSGVRQTLIWLIHIGKAVICDSSCSLDIGERDGGFIGAMGARLLSGCKAG